MNFENVTDENVDLKLGLLISSEREILTEILHHLREVERRRLYSKYKFRSLFEYAVKRFGYSEDQVYRRISAMKLMVELPEIESRSASGSLSLSNIAQAQTLFRQEKKESKTRSSEEKLLLLRNIEGLSKNAASEVLTKNSLPPQNLQLQVGMNEIRFSLSNELQNKLDRLKEFRSTSEFHELLDQMADLALFHWDPLEKAKRASVKKSVPDQKRRVANSRQIPARLKHAVFIRDRGQCTNCGTTRKIEIDHVSPWAQGGSHEVENLRLLCRSCNQRHAIESYGHRKMRPFLRSRSVGYEVASCAQKIYLHA